MATQTSLSSNSGYTYDVFLSFRGIDTRKSFTDHLYKALKQAGVETFRDDDEIPRGENINSELERAIKQSRMSIIIFSKDYTSSSACLYEVTTILEHSKHSRHTILPVFYHVEPAELKQQARDLASVLTKEDQKGWSKALEEVASMAGMPLKDQYESDFIAQIVEGTNRIEGMILDMNMVKRSKSRRNSNEEVLEASAFEKMRNLRLLKLSHIQLSGTYEVLPRKIRWLYWRGFHLNSLPYGFPLENLVALEMRNNSLKQFWKATKVLESLKLLNLSHSTELVKTPDFSSTPNLEQLILKHCPRLVEVDESIVNLERLIFMNLSDCINLRKLPRNIGMVKSLKQLIISGCSNLVGVASELEKMKSLEVLEADRIETSQALSDDTFPAWYNLIPCITKPCKNPEISWGSLPSSLVTLTLVGSNLSDESFPKNLGNLPALRHLYLGGNPICKLPKCIRNLRKLEMLSLFSCQKLQQIIWPPINVKELSVSECRSLKKITYESSGHLGYISHGACMSLDYVEKGFKIEAVAKVDREVLMNFGFSELISMETVEVMIANRIILYESCVFSTYFPGREVPHWFDLKTTEPTTSFTIPKHQSLEFRGLNLCLLYTMSETEWMPTPISVQIKNTSNNAKIKYEPRCYGISEVNGDMVWLTHWCSVLWGSLFEVGDELEVSFYMNLFSTNENVEEQIKGCGVQILYFEEDEGVAKYFNTLYCSWDSGMDIFIN
ncbi:hypothetical protein LguiB_028047 [Lonicera macranthoides]